MEDESAIDYPAKIRESMMAHAAPHQVFEGLFSSDELAQIEDLKVNSEKVEKFNGIINYKFPKGAELESFLRQKLEPIIGPFMRHGGSYVETPEPFNAHTDTGKADEMKGEYFPYKNILVPLISSEEGRPLYTVLFKQRHFGQASHLWRGKEFEEKKPIYNFKMTDYSKLQNFTQVEFDRSDHKSWLSHLPMDCLYGLSIESTIEWKRGDLIIFDCSQIHASNNFKPSGAIKHCLTLFTSKAID